MDSRYNIGLYNKYQQSKKQEMSLEEAIKIVSGAALKYFTNVGIDINPKYGYVKTGDGRFGIVRTDPESIAAYISISDPIAKAIGDIAEEYIPIDNLDKLVSNMLRDIGFTVIVGDRPDIHISKRQTNNSSQK